MNFKTSITIIIGCLIIFLFVMLPIFLSIEKKENEYVKKFQGSSFSLNDVNNDIITESSFEGPLTAVFFGFTNCPDVCPMTLNNLDLAIKNLDQEKKDELIRYIIKISDILNIPAIYVSHSISETFMLGERIHFIENGSLPDGYRLC